MWISSFISITTFSGNKRLDENRTEVQRRTFLSTFFVGLQYNMNHRNFHERRKCCANKFTFWEPLVCWHIAPSMGMTNPVLFILRQKNVSMNYQKCEIFTGGINEIPEPNLPLQRRFPRKVKCKAGTCLETANRRLIIQKTVLFTTPKHYDAV